MCKEKAYKKCFLLNLIPANFKLEQISKTLHQQIETSIYYMIQFMYVQVIFYLTNNPDSLLCNWLVSSANWYYNKTDRYRYIISLYHISLTCTSATICLVGLGTSNLDTCEVNSPTKIDRKF